MMLKRIVYILVVAACAVSCSTSKHTLQNTMVGGLTGVEYIGKVIKQSHEKKNITARTSIELKAGNKRNVRVNASLRMRRDEVIRISVAPLFGIEVARIDITPGYILAIDRMNKRYVKADFGELSGILRTEVNFNIIQALFMNELFLPGKTGISASDAEKFSLLPSGSRIRLDLKSSKRVGFSFFTSATDGKLEETVISLKNSPYSLKCEYGNFTSFQSDVFPQKIKFSSIGLNEDYFFGMNLSRLGNDSNWSSETDISSRYSEISLKELLEILFK